jgi:gamma-glutamyl:cysteine ligase YbdK (ATP-grasp superfamily)
VTGLTLAIYYQAEAPDFLEFELQEQQLEVNTRPCGYLDELGREVRRCRAAAAEAAAETGAGLAALGTSPVPVQPELLHLAAWRASRSGIESTLVHPVTGRPAPVRQVARALLDHVRPALDTAGDFPVVADLLDAVLSRGNGAMFQRNAYRKANSLLDIIGGALQHTAPG